MAQASTMSVTSAPELFLVRLLCVLGKEGPAQVELESFNVNGSELSRPRAARPSFALSVPRWTWVQSVGRRAWLMIVCAGAPAPSVPGGHGLARGAFQSALAPLILSL